MCSEQPAAPIEAWLINYLAQTCGIDRRRVDTRLPFAAYGLRSIECAMLVRGLEQWLDHTLSPTLAWDYPTIDRLARHLSATYAAPTS